MLSYNETKTLIEDLLSVDQSDPRDYIFVMLTRMNSSEGEFYTSVA
jgi:hypothetical protein